MKIIYNFILILILTISNLYAYPAEVEDISSRNYYPKVKEVIDNAEKSIHMSMFVVALRPNQKNSVVYQLCNALIDAKKRGVSVRVILDQNVNYFNKEKRGEIEGKNEEAATISVNAYTLQAIALINSGQIDAEKLVKVFEANIVKAA